MSLSNILSNLNTQVILIFTYVLLKKIMTKKYEIANTIGSGKFKLYMLTYIYVMLKNLCIFYVASITLI